jgi:hypothetical protein
MAPRLSAMAPRLSKISYLDLEACFIFFDKLERDRRSKVL